MVDTIPLLIGKEQVFRDNTFPVFNPFSGRIIANQCLATAQDIAKVINRLEEGSRQMRRLSARSKAAILNQIAAGLQEQREDLAKTIALEAGKPIRDARGEVDRAIHVCTLAAAYCGQITGDVLPLDINPNGAGYTGYVHPLPVGPVLAITPFNFPLNLVCHKLAPAIAAGCPFVHRPSSKTPITGYKLGMIVQHTDMPRYGYSFLPCKKQDVQTLLASGRIKKLSFTGSAQVGWRLKQQAFRLPVTLELGGNAAAIVMKDADIDYAAQRCVRGAYAFQGQVCISVQRIFVQQECYEPFVATFLDKARQLVCGNPLLEDVDIGPLIDPEAGTRIAGWLQAALQSGARYLLTPETQGPVLTPFALTATRPEMVVEKEELFGPGVCIRPYQDIADALSWTNHSRYGLQAGLFTYDQRMITKAFSQLEVGALIVNDVPTFRGDSMPYGGVKNSGCGREGIAYAVDSMLQPRLMVVHNLEM